MLFLLAIATAVQLLIWLFVFRPALRASKPVATDHDRPVSVIVCYHDEAANLEACLRAILEQDHPNFEVIAVDDRSEDDSPAIAERLQKEFPRLRTVAAGSSRPGKKDALTAGISAASHDLLLLTDADCRPASRQWLTLMTAPLTDGNDLVLGASPYRRVPGLLNRWQRFETTGVAMQYLGLARLGMPYMGTGRNLAYTRAFFDRAGGLEAHADLPGGDDDLLVNGEARSVSTARVTDPAAWTISEPTPDWESYIYQKSRHQSAGLRYRIRHQVLLVAIAASHGLFYLGGLMIILTPLVEEELILYGLRAAVVVATYLRYPTNLFLGGGAGAMRIWQVPILLVFDAVLSLYYVFLFFASFGDRRSW